MEKLQPDFDINKYGLYARLANENDADFILSLRTNKELTKYIHHTDNDKEKQIEWLRDYKKREEEGRDYYFVYFYHGERVGFNRIYNRSELYATSGSWLCKPGIEPWIPIAQNFILNDIIFEVLKIEVVICDVRKDNKKVNKYHLLIGDKEIHKSRLDVFYYRTKETYIPYRDKYIKIYNIK